MSGPPGEGQNVPELRIMLLNVGVGKVPQPAGYGSARLNWDGDVPSSAAGPRRQRIPWCEPPGSRSGTTGWPAHRHKDWAWTARGKRVHDHRGGLRIVSRGAAPSRSTARRRIPTGAAGSCRCSGPGGRHRGRVPQVAGVCRMPVLGVAARGRAQVSGKRCVARMFPEKQFTGSAAPAMQVGVVGIAGVAEGPVARERVVRHMPPQRVVEAAQTGDPAMWRRTPWCRGRSARRRWYCRRDTGRRPSPRRRCRGSVVGRWCRSGRRRWSSRCRSVRARRCPRSGHSGCCCSPPVLRVNTQHRVGEACAGAPAVLGRWRVAGEGGVGVEPVLVVVEHGVLDDDPAPRVRPRVAEGVVLHPGVVDGHIAGPLAGPHVHPRVGEVVGVEVAQGGGARRVGGEDPVEGAGGAHTGIVRVAASK